MDFRKVFDLIPEEFDRWRPRYCPEALKDVIAYAGLGPGKKVLEIGPGTGQATEPLLLTGCDYAGIDLGEHLCAFMRERFREYPNLRVICGDFCTHDFGAEKFDLIFSAAAIQWIPEETAFCRCRELLKPGGALVMIANLSDENARNAPELVADKERVYEMYFHPEIPYTCGINKRNAVLYGFSEPEISDFFYDADMTADEYVSWTMTHCDHILLAEPERSLFMNGLRDAVNRHGGVWRRRDRVNVVKTRKLTETER